MSAKTIKVKQNSTGGWYIDFDAPPYLRDKRTGKACYTDEELKRIAKAMRYELTDARLPAALAALGNRTQTRKEKK